MAPSVTRCARTAGEQGDEGTGTVPLPHLRGDHRSLHADRGLGGPHHLARHPLASTGARCLHACDLPA